MEKKLRRMTWNKVIDMSNWLEQSTSELCNHISWSYFLIWNKDIMDIVVLVTLNMKNMKMGRPWQVQLFWNKINWKTAEILQQASYLHPFSLYWVVQKKFSGYKNETNKSLGFTDIFIAIALLNNCNTYKFSAGSLYDMDLIAVLRGRLMPKVSLKN